MLFLFDFVMGSFLQLYIQLEHSDKLSDYEELQRAAKEREEIWQKYDKGREEGAEIEPWEDPEFSVYHVTDRYGFIHEHRLPPTSSSEVKLRQQEYERSQKWMKMLRNWDKYYGGEKMARRVYKGIPERMRGIVWARLLDVKKVKSEQEGIYEKMIMRSRKVSPYIKQIDMDVNRTYRNNIMFRDRYGVKQKALFNVLAGYSMYNTEVGYCQGMSEIAALLLMYLDEEDSFWGLSQLLTDKKHGMHGLFMPGFPKLIRLQEHHDNILRKYLGKLRKQLLRQEVYPSLYSIKWFLQCFLDRTPFSLNLRLWDIFMLEGERLLVGMAYNICKMHRRKLVRMQMDEILNFLHYQLEKDFGYDDDTVIDQLQLSLDELRKGKMDVGPKPKSNEFPTLPFGLDIQPSIEQYINKKPIESLDEHFRKNVRSGKSYARKRATSSSTTPELSRSRADTRSMQSGQYSEYSTDDRSSYYDTATNSRLSLLDFNSRTSNQSSRTSFADASDISLSIGMDSTTNIDEVDAASVDAGSAETAREFMIGSKTPEGMILDNEHKTAGENVQTPDYDNLYDKDNETNKETQMIPSSIPISKSDGFIVNKTPATKQNLTNGFGQQSDHCENMLKVSSSDHYISGVQETFQEQNGFLEKQDLNLSTATVAPPAVVTMPAKEVSTIQMSKPSVYMYM
ncbi:USP6 N-terminal-like protein isoform X1 [Octopus bimaculoides]|uniref:USP6 N-terminal-like protein isoform X1 n=1 Tax=Octopus bimaculoides TaxID=37653 RepID=UPI00071DF65C|nr:USP6 N-terminal-like protein isoform X1 [Octopus bimaculoides]|eukprot:XP_014767907.1 PREDICTED: USP6 N-terminal-like protein isoform X1 [Octopus bimaculoides]